MITTFDKALTAFVSALFVALAARYPALEGWGPVIDAALVILLGVLAGGATWLVPNKPQLPPERDPQDPGTP